MRNDLNGGVGVKISRMTLARQLTLLGTIPILIAVAVLLGVLHAETRRQTKEVLQRAIQARHKLIADVQDRRAEQRFRLFAVALDSPTLRAALETLRVERFAGAESSELLAETVRVEASKVASTLDTDLLALLDDKARVLAVAGAGDVDFPPDAAFADLDIVSRALDPGFRYSAGDFAVLEAGDALYRVSAVPVVLQGYILGALVAGDRLDAAYLADLKSLFDGDLLLTVGGKAVETTLPAGDRLEALGAALGQSAGQVSLVGGEEFVAAPLSLGFDSLNREVEILAFDSLTAAVAASERTIRGAVVLAGSFALLLAFVAVWVVSRSAVRPLERFVDFMRDVTDEGEYSRRFRSPAAAREVRQLAEAYNTLSDSLLRRTREDMDQLERLKESEKLAALGRMLSGAAHEINNPLTGVVGNIEMVLHEGGVDPRARDRLQTVRREGRRIVALVRNLLKVSHRQTEERRTFDVNRALCEVAELRRHDFTAANLSLEFDLAPEEALVHGNDLELQQVFLNIVNNAHDALVERGGPGRLEISTRLNAERVSIRFSDDGPGLRDAQQVFEHFYTTKPVGKGTGLGLSITYATVKSHGGEVSAENMPAGGARFTVDLPRTAGATSVAPTPQAEPTVADPKVEPLRASVLVADDEPGVLELQLSILDAFGASAVGVSNGTEAIRELERRDFDLLVSDMKMPGEIGGKELYRWVRDNRPELVDGFIFVTGDTIDDQEFLEQEGRRYLDKPFAMDEYVAALRAALEARRRAA